VRRFNAALSGGARERATAPAVATCADRTFLTGAESRKGVIGGPVDRRPVPPAPATAAATAPASNAVIADVALMGDDQPARLMEQRVMPGTLPARKQPQPILKIITKLLIVSLQISTTPHIIPNPRCITRYTVKQNA